MTITRTCPSCGSEVPAGFRFCGRCGRGLDDDADLAGPPSVSGAERREVTVLFADMRGFTTMSEKLDPEQVHALMNECFAGLGRAIQAEGGHIDKYIGDNVMALFGAPVAHEDDPARACRAALAMQAFMRNFAERARALSGVEPSLRIGIHSGLVLAGGVGSDVRMDYSVMGDAVNLASRLEGAATPGTVLVSRVVESRARGHLGFGPARQLSMKGREEPVEALELLGERAGSAPLARTALSVELVGREEDVRKLQRRWDALEKTGGWMEVQGEIGVGKTRLVEETVSRGARSIVVVTGSPSAQRRPFGLARNLLLAIVRELRAGGREPIARQDLADALRSLGEDVAAFTDVLWYLAAPASAAVAPPDPDPRTLRRRLEKGVATLLFSFARHSPGAALFLDGYELADEASAALLESLARRPAGLPIVAIATLRERRAAPRPEAVLHLEPLGPSTSAELLDRLLRGAVVPEELRCDLLTRAAGVPLFLEEMVQALVDQGLLRETDGSAWIWAGGTTVGAMSLPSSVRAAMVARLDRLERPLREVLRQCSVQGVEFDVRVAGRVTGLVAHGTAGGGAAGDEGIAALVPVLAGLGLVTDAGREEPGHWAFRQPLMQEACYETLLLRERRTLHGEIADALCEVYGGEELVSPTILAHHFEKAERWSPAGAANLRAANQAAELFLNEEALRRFARTLVAVDQAGPSPEAEAVRVRAHAGAARVHLRTGAYALVHDHARALRTAAARLADRAEADRLAGAAWAHLGRAEEGERLLRAAVDMARSRSDARDVLTEALYDLAELALRAGRNEEALTLLRECRDAAGSDPSRVSLRADMLEGRIAHTEGRFSTAAALYAHAAQQAIVVGSLSEQAAAANNLGNAARDQGDYETARNDFQRALEVWERTGDAEGVAGAHNNLGNVEMSRGVFDEARRHYELSLAVSREIGNVHASALAQANLAILALEEGEGVAGRRAAEAALETLEGSANELLRGLVLVVAGEARVECGDIPGARATFEAVLRDYDDARHPLAVAGARRGLGRLFLSEGKPEDALALLTPAVEAFERLQRAQEAARTAIYRAEALRLVGEWERALEELRRTRERFIAIHAVRDAERVGRLLSEMTPPRSRRAPPAPAG